MLHDNNVIETKTREKVSFWLNRVKDQKLWGFVLACMTTRAFPIKIVLIIELNFCVMTVEQLYWWLLRRLGKNNSNIHRELE